MKNVNVCHCTKWSKFQSMSILNLLLFFSIAKGSQSPTVAFLNYIMELACASSFIHAFFLYLVLSNGISPFLLLFTLSFTLSHPRLCLSVADLLAGGEYCVDCFLLNIKKCLWALYCSLPNLALNLKSTQFCDKIFLPVALKASLQIVSFYFHTTVSLFLFSPPFFSLLGCCDCILAFGLWGSLT